MFLVSRTCRSDQFRVEDVEDSGVDCVDSFSVSWVPGQLGGGREQSDLARGGVLVQQERSEDGQRGRVQC